MRRGLGVLFSVVVAVGGLVGHTAAAHATSTVPVLSVGDVAVYEGNSGSVTITVPVDLSFAAATKVTVLYTIGGGSATAGVDYTGGSGKLAFAIGVTEKIVKVTIFGNTVPEGNRDVHITLSTPTGATIVDPTGDVMILDDDNAGSLYQVAIGDAVVTEGDAGAHYAYVPVTLSSPATATVKVQVTFECGTVTADEEIGSTPTTLLTFLAGQQVKELKFAIPANTTPQALTEFWEKIKVTIGGVAVSAPTGSVTVLDNDGGQTPGQIDRESVASDGTQAEAFNNVGACQAAIGSRVEETSVDGRYVTFASDAVNLVPGDTNGQVDLFLRDRVAGTTERIDVTDTGGELSQGVSNPTTGLSDDGRYVLFGTGSPEITPAGMSAAVFVRDRSNGTNELASVLPDGTLPSIAFPTGMSADGNSVAFQAGGILYVRDRATATTQLVASATGWFHTPMTADGSEIAFVSADSTLVPGDTNNYPDVFVRNLVTGATERVNIDPSGAQEVTNMFNVNASRLAMSRDGRYVAFWQGVPDMSSSNIFVRDRVAQTTQQASVGITPPSPLLTNCFAQSEGVSDDGRYVSFNYHCEQADSVGRVTDLTAIYVHDFLTNATTRVDKLPDGTPSDADPRFEESATISGDGHYVMFDSIATNLVANDTNDIRDVFSRLMN
jgi:Tol biopolymer transport system component